MAFIQNGMFTIGHVIGFVAPLAMIITAFYIGKKLTIAEVLFCLFVGHLKFTFDIVFYLNTSHQLLAIWIKYYGTRIANFASFIQFKKFKWLFF